MAKKNELLKKITYVSIGAISALVIMGLAIVMLAPSLMMNEYESKYDFNETVELFQQRVNESSWGILNTHDMQAIKANLGYDVLPVKIFDLCSGQYSYEILSRDDERIVTPLMPCRVSIYEKSNGQTYIGMMNAGLVARLFGGVINDVMQKATSETLEIISPIIN